MHQFRKGFSSPLSSPWTLRSGNFACVCMWQLVICVQSLSALSYLQAKAISPDPSLPAYGVDFTFEHLM